jgi:1,4-alpha-glucan branching enzyme
MKMRNLLLVATLLTTLGIGACTLRGGGVHGDSGKRNPAYDIDFYEFSRTASLAPTRDWKDFASKQGIRITQRDGQGNATRGEIRVLTDNPKAKVAFACVGKCREPGRVELKPDPADAHYMIGSVAVNHGMQYRLEFNGRQVLDPAANLFTTPGFNAKFNGNSDAFLNSAFWDLDRPDAYRPRSGAPNLVDRPVIIAESEVHALAARYARPLSEGQVGPAFVQDTYKFIATSGLVHRLAESGYNAVELLPFNQSVDGDSWHYRYQVFGLFAPESRYGSPDEFAEMVDAFNREGINVIMDSVVGHWPERANDGSRSLEPIGLSQWKKEDGRQLFGDNDSPFGTKRYDYANPFIRRFLTDSILTMLKQYRIGGIRFDNLDGIRFENGGTEFLKELIAEIRAYAPQTLLIGEMFFGESKVTQRIDQGGIGVGVRTDSMLFDWIKDNMLLTESGVNMGGLRDALRKPWEWGEVARVKYATNHDEAANRRDGATGQYTATLIKAGNDAAWPHVEGKVRAFGALTMLSGSVYLDMPQMRLLQEGSFYSNPAVQWELRDPFHKNEHLPQYRAWEFFATLSNYVKNESAFAFKNLHADIENSVDDQNGHRIVTMLRIDKASGKRIYCLINLGASQVVNYKVGVETGADRLALIVDSNFGKSEAAPGGFVQVNHQDRWQGKNDSIVIPFVDSYAVLVFETR